MIGIQEWVRYRGIHTLINSHILINCKRLLIE